MDLITNFAIIGDDRLGNGQGSSLPVPESAVPSTIQWSIINVVDILLGRASVSHLVNY